MHVESIMQSWTAMPRLLELILDIIFHGNAKFHYLRLNRDQNEPFGSYCYHLDNINPISIISFFFLSSKLVILLFYIIN